MEALTMSMHKIGVMSQKEAIAMRIITVVTLIFLPATFVSVIPRYDNESSVY
jgi:Mg2+ and Co2+ transporter CorA